MRTWCKGTDLHWGKAEGTYNMSITRDARLEFGVISRSNRDLIEVMFPFVFWYDGWWLVASDEVVGPASSHFGGNNNYLLLSVFI